MPWDCVILTVKTIKSAKTWLGIHQITFISIEQTT